MTDDERARIAKFAPYLIERSAQPISLMRRHEGIDMTSNNRTQHAQEAAFSAGRECERRDVLAWLASGDGFEDIIELLKGGAHEGADNDEQ